MLVIAAPMRSSHPAFLAILLVIVLLAAGYFIGRMYVNNHGGQQRAPARLRPEQVVPVVEDITEPSGPRQRDLADRYAAAIENADLAALVSLVRGDVTLEMPPLVTWFAGVGQLTPLPGRPCSHRSRAVHGGPCRGQRGYVAPGWLAGRCYCCGSRL